MKLFLLLLVFSVPLFAQKDSTLSAPSDAEVVQLLGHVDALMTVFKASVQTQQSLIKRDYTDDNKLIAQLRDLSTKLRVNPQGFNSAAGYLVVRHLFGIIQSELTCTNEALIEGDVYLLSGKSQDASSYAKLASSCSDAVLFAKTVLDSADGMYSRSALVNDDLRNRAFNTASKCAEVLQSIQGAKAK